MQTLKVKAENREAFDRACSNGYIYGEWLDKRPKLYAYADLGKEGVYQPKLNDDQNTDFKIFYNCDVYLSRTKEVLKDGCFEYSESMVTVIVYASSSQT